MPTEMKVRTQGGRAVRVNAEGWIVCRVCSCTSVQACNPPCSWAEEDLCSTCAEAVEAILFWEDAANRPNWSAFRREAASMRKQERIRYGKARKA